MGWRTVMISRPASLSLCQGQLSLAQEGQTVSVPLEDIDSVVLDSCHTQVSGQLLSAWAHHQAAVFICDDKHLPIGVLQPFNSHHRMLKVMRRQLVLGKPLKKQLWQSLVRAKVSNQAQTLYDFHEHGAARLLNQFIKKIRSGDPENIEAQAAAAYFRALFGPQFGRRKNLWCNAALNYAYSLIRGLLARSLCAAGYQPALGLGHDNEQNAFNLADDLLEPWRPLVDRWVLNLSTQAEISATGELAPDHKRYLVTQLGSEALLQGERFVLSAAVNEQIASLGRAMSSGRAERLKHPLWAPPQSELADDGT